MKRLHWKEIVPWTFAVVSIVFNLLQYISAGSSGKDMAEFHDHAILNDLLTTRERMLKEYDTVLENQAQEFRQRMYSYNQDTVALGYWLQETSRKLEEQRLKIIRRIQPMEVASGVRSRYTEYKGIGADTLLFMTLKRRCISEVRDAFVERTFNRKERKNGYADLLVVARAIDPTLVCVQITEDVNIRRRPRENSSVLGAALAGEAYDLVDCTGDLGWYYLSFPGRSLEGWVDSRYVEPIPLLRAKRSSLTN